MDTKIAIVGTGNVGGNLGVRFTQSGYSVRFGVREGKDVASLLERCSGRASACAPAEAAEWADLIVLAVPSKAALEAARSLGEVPGKVVVDATNPLTWDAGPVHAPPPEGSNARAIAATLDGAHVVKAWNTFGAEFHIDPAVGDTSADLYFAGDDEAAKQTVADVASRCGWEPVDCGPLRNAAVLENLAILWIHLALVGGKGRDSAFKLLAR